MADRRKRRLSPRPVPRRLITEGGFSEDVVLFHSGGAILLDDDAFPAPHADVVHDAFHEDAGSS